MTSKPEPLLWLNDSRGIYIPRDFASSFTDRDKDVQHVDAEQWSILEAGPEHEFYWDTWDDVCGDAIVTIGSIEYHVWQDGDCWLIPDGMEYDDHEGAWVWLDEEDDDDDDEDAADE